MKMENVVKELVINCATFPKGIKAYIAFNDVGMHYCGYIEIPEEVSESLNPELDLGVLGQHVHGGVTYDERSADTGGKRVIGFDCNHSCDYTVVKARWDSAFTANPVFPQLFNVGLIPTPQSAAHFRTHTYVIRELENLVTALGEFHLRTRANPVSRRV